MPPVILSIFPSLFTLISIILTYIFIDVETSLAIRPNLAVITLYFWISHKPQSLPYLLVLIFGIISDILANSAMGMHAFGYIIVWLIHFYRQATPVLKTNIGWWFTGAIAITSTHFIFWFGYLLKHPEDTFDFRFVYTILLAIAIMPIQVFILYHLRKIFFIR